MDLDIEQYNYVIPPYTEYIIRGIAGLCTQTIDTPVTRSSLLYENRSLLLQTSSLQQSISSIRQIPSISKRRDITVYLENAPNNGIPNKLRGIPILFGVTIIGHLSSYVLDKIIPQDIISLIQNDDLDEKDDQSGITNYCYSWSMHLYNKCKIQNLNILGIVNNHDNDNNDNGYKHNWNHNRLIRKIIISSLSSILTYPLYTIYTKIAFDIGEVNNNNNINNNDDLQLVDFKYKINGWCSNIWSIGKQIVYSPSGSMNIGNLYSGYHLHLLHIILYQSLIHYSREYLIEISPKVHNNRFVNKYLSKKNDPFEYSMFCIWWIPPIVCRVICYPLIKLRNKYIINGKINNLISTIFHGVIANTTRYMTEIQMCELFGLWSLIRYAHREQYKLLLFEQKHNECAICYGDRGKADIVFVPCGHKFCKSDAYDVISRNMSCPTCKREILNTFTDLGKWKKLFML